MTARQITTPLMRAALLCLWLAGCTGTPNSASLPPAPTPTPVGAPEYAEFAETIAQYPYHAPRQRVAKVTSGLGHVKKCMTKSRIRSLLGAADYGRRDYGPKGPHERWLGSSWTYILSMQDQAAMNDDKAALNEQVKVFFDTNDRAVWIAPYNIANAKEIGGPGEKCSLNPS